MSYFIFYFPTKTFWQNRTNILVHIISEIFREFENWFLINGVKNFYKLDTENIKENEFFGNIDNDSYIIVENPYVTEENNDLNKSIYNNFYYGNIKLGIIKEELK